jgi:hypothetical protein
MPAQKDAAEAAEFAALVAELSAEEVTGDEPGDDSAAQDDEASADPGDEPEEQDPDQEEDEPAEEELEEEDDPEADPDDLETELTEAEIEAKKLLEGGDLKAACKRLGVDPKIFKVKPREFTAMRKGLREAAIKERNALTYERQGKQLHEAAEQTYGPIVAGFRGHQGGRPLDVKAAIELMCEDSFENVVAGIARAAKGLSPAEAEVLRLRKERADEKAQTAAQAAQAAAAQQEAQEVTALTGRLKGTPLERVEGAAAEIRALVVKSFDGVGYGLTVKEAYAQVKSKYSKIAESVTGKPLSSSKGQRPGDAKPGKGKKRSELAPLRRVAASTPAEKKAAQKAAEAEEFRASVREASAAGNRLGRRYGRS